MNLRQLRYIIAVSEFGSFTRAAEKLYVSQPALTRAIQLLEKELGAKLFERTTRKIVPTPSGITFIRRASVVLSELNSSRHELIAPKAEKRSFAAVNGSPMTAPKLIPTVVARLLAEHPDMWISIRGEMDVDHESKLKSLMNGDLDVVLSLGVLPAASDGLIREHLLAPDLKIIARRGHPITKRTDISIRELMKHKWILPPRGASPRIVFDNEFSASGADGPHEYLEISDRQMILSLVRQSNFLTAIPYHPACVEDDWSDVYVLPTPFATKPLSISIITRSRAYLSPAAKAFIAITKEVVQQAESVG